MSVCPYKRPYECPSVRPSIFNMNELLQTYCYSTKNLRNYAFVCLFLGNRVDKYTGINARISRSTGDPAKP